MKMTEQEETTAWAKMPSQLQHEFMGDAGREAEKVKKSLAQKLKKLERLKKSFETKKIPENDNWKKLRVAAVDGSNSPSTSERLGVRYGAFAAGFMIFEGNRIVDEGYRSGSYSQEQLSDRDIARDTLSMLRTRLEREVALYCLQKNVDYILIDGSFFGYGAEALMINGKDIGVQGYNNGSELTLDIGNKTWELLKSGKVAGIIKRTRTSVIDGWLTKMNGTAAECLNMNDKYAMTYILPLRHWFAFEWLLEEKSAHHYHARFRNVFRLFMEKGRNLSTDVIWGRTKKNFERNCIRNLLKTGALVSQSARYFVRCSANPPFQFEMFEKADPAPLLPYFLAFHNPATGLPWPIDLIDANVSVPQGFTKEFVDEVQARLLHDPEMSDKLKLMEFFSYLNPQKEEE
ncbi:MAG: DNA double-strand break repair nuclease NurA [Thaumarchaeota archaeon]|nr:DNA double-strand break repair nuclease NurA [Nitrososphaerota archaeon]